MELLRAECKQRKDRLLQLRDSRAIELGKLLAMKPELNSAIKSQEQLDRVSREISTILGDKNNDQISSDTVHALGRLQSEGLTSHTQSHKELFSSLSRPSRLTLLWPRLALGPPVALLLFRTIYGSRQTIVEQSLKVYDTLKGFWFGYVIEPVKAILDTVRTGGDDTMRIVSQEGLKADLEV